MTPGAASGGQRPIHECLHEEEWPLLRRLMARVDQIWEILSDVRALTKGKDGHTAESLIIRVPLAEARLGSVESRMNDLEAALEKAADKRWGVVSQCAIILLSGAAGAYLHHWFASGGIATAATMIPK